jgi:putative ubiquitin-RnfH superfamily antitoxin RatB of RatAB toxin-antitoxin module
MSELTIKVEVAYALADEQFLFELNVPQGVTAEEAVRASPLLSVYPDLDISKLGIFSRPVENTILLREGDRVEVYRPLKADPRERRRKQVEIERAEVS